MAAARRDHSETAKLPSIQQEAVAGRTWHQEASEPCWEAVAEVRSDLSSKAEQRGRVGSSASNLPKALQPSSSIGSQKRPDRNRLDHSLSGESPDGSRQAARSQLSMYVAGPRRSRGPFLRESGAEISQILRGPGLPFSGHTEISTAQGYTDSLSLAR